MRSGVQTETFETIEQYRLWRQALPKSSERPPLGFVPTMGALHEGHATLIKRARAECEQVVVSIFVNPLQFGPNEDFNRYPRTFPNDERICRDAGVDAIFHPGVHEMYPRQGVDTTRVMPPPELINRLCGLFRPGHFEGVATVVMKLFGIIEPTIAYFGEKDYQQLAVIKHMVADLNFPTRVIGVPTVRDDDGLALSSRNVYLSPEERVLAPILQQVLQRVKDEVLSGDSTVATALAKGKERLEAVPGLTLQYLEACHAETLLPLEQAARPMVVLVAAKLGNVRLIDNVVAV
jgi:pantoate--beta-alanine ligase